MCIAICMGWDCSPYLLAILLSTLTAACMLCLILPTSRYTASSMLHASLSTLRRTGYNCRCSLVRVMLQRLRLRSSGNSIRREYYHPPFNVQRLVHAQIRRKIARSVQSTCTLMRCEDSRLRALSGRPIALYSDGDIVNSAHSMFCQH